MSKVLDHQPEDTTISKTALRATLIVAALGYFVDVFDLILFGVIRTASLRDLGLSGDELTRVGVYLVNMQMAGLLIGGLVWGVFTDRFGRRAGLFGSIICYSLATIANGFVHSIEAYAILRLIAGFGLAGELGAGVTLVLELMKRGTRGLGPTAIATVGVVGAVVAAIVGAELHWRTAYFIGGGLGIVLLCLRIGSSESKLFRAMTPQWSLWCLVKSPARLWRYALLVLIALPTWYVVGIYAIFTPEIARAIHFQGPTPPTAGNAIMYAYIGLVFGDFASGMLSQLLRSRVRAIGVFIVIAMLAIANYFFSARHNLLTYYGAMVLLGFSVGYWAVFVTLAAESFGTNLRGTVATSVPNFVRGALIPMTTLWQYFKGEVGVIQSCIIVGAMAFSLALVGVLGLKDTFTRDLDYHEA